MTIFDKVFDFFVLYELQNEESVKSSLLLLNCLRASCE